MARPDREADKVITGTVLTVDDAPPTAEALAGGVMPGFVEAHGHPPQVYRR